MLPSAGCKKDSGDDEHTAHKGDEPQHHQRATSRLNATIDPHWRPSRRTSCLPAEALFSTSRRLVGSTLSAHLRPLSIAATAVGGSALLARGLTSVKSNQIAVTSVAPLNQLGRIFRPPHEHPTG